MGLTKIIVMIPFCRTVDEGKKVIETMKKYGLVRGKNGLKVYAMCEIPSNVLLAEEFLDVFDGFSIGTNDLTQLTLGIDRNNEKIAKLFDEMHPAVLGEIEMVLSVAKKYGVQTSICGQAGSKPEMARFLVKRGCTSISANPDAVAKIRETVAKVEKELGVK